MAININKWDGPRYDFELDVTGTTPSGKWDRKRVGFKGSKAHAKRRANELLAEIVNGVDEQITEQKEVPTLAEFESKFITHHVEANNLKPTTVATYKRRLRLHLVPKLGHLRLDQIDRGVVQDLKAQLKGGSASSINDTLGVLTKLLSFALDLGVIVGLPFRFRQVKLKEATPEMKFYDFAEYARIVEAASRSGDHDLALVLFGGDAGLRRGEIAALEWEDVDLWNEVLTVRRTVYQGEVTLPKGGRARKLPMTKRLVAVLRAIKPKDKEKAQGRVLRRPDGRQHTETSINEVMPRITKAAGLEVSRKVHILRHTFCSHLAMRGASPISIKELAGHTDLATTQRYMHLSPAMKDSAIRLLEQPIPEGAAA
jgi:integrase